MNREKEISNDEVTRQITMNKY